AAAGVHREAGQHASIGPAAAARRTRSVAMRSGALVGVCLALFLAACNRGVESGAKKKPVVGVSLLTQTHAFYKELEDGLREEAKARDLELVIVACEMDPARQAAQIEDFVAQRVAALLVAPCDSS